MSMTETEELPPIAPERDSRSIIELIDHLEYLVHRGQRVPFTHNVMIDEDEILDLLDQIHVNMPEEIKQSRTVLAEQERLLSEAQQESARITQTAAQKAEGMVTNHELARKAEDKGQAIIREAQSHQLVILGATLSLMHRPMVLGAPASRLLRRLPGTVMVVKTAGPVQVRDPERPPRPETRAASGERVDRWFAENTFHSREFSDLKRLVGLKQRQGITISLGLPTLNEQLTIGKVVRTFKHALMDQVPLLDEIVVIDSGSSDRTIRVAERIGVPVVQHAEILPRYGALSGKGEALWKSLFTLKGDLICWVDTDISNIHPKFVYGLLGPLLTDPEISYVKGFYRRPLRYGSELMAQGGGRVTELAARPLLNARWPELAAVVPRGRRDCPTRCHRIHCCTLQFAVGRVVHRPEQRALHGGRACGSVPAHFERQPGHRLRPAWAGPVVRLYGRLPRIVHVRAGQADRRTAHPGAGRVRFVGSARTASPMG